MKLQTKVLTSFLAVGLTVALVGGSTMAWFTDKKDVDSATFKAGTVVLDDDSTMATLSTVKDSQNINPGDPFSYQLNIKYIGTKPVYLRVKMPSLSWGNHESIDNIYLNSAAELLNTNSLFNYKKLGTPISSLVGNMNGVKDTTRWYYNAADGYCYYMDPLAGTETEAGITGVQGGSVLNISLNGVFDGALTNNSYQGDTVTLGGYSVEVIQITNGAVSVTDGIPSWVTGSNPVNDRNTPSVVH